MKILKFFLILFFINSSLLAQQKKLNLEIDSTYDGKQFVKGEFLIKLKPQLKSSTNYLRLQQNVQAAKQKYYLITKKEWRTNVQLWKTSSTNLSIDLDSVSSIIGKENIEFIEPNYIIKASDLNNKMESLPTDPLFSEQWGLNNTGNNSGMDDIDIDAPEAWEITKGNKEIIVGIFDSGIDYNHEDLKNNIWTNPKEIAGNGIDDDGNGYIDDIHGYDFVDNDEDPMDEYKHGTHVAGIIGAGENGIGIVGVAPNVALVSLRILNQYGYGTVESAINAFQYAIDNNIKITNHSWGGPYSEALEEIIAETGNMLIVAAAGNKSLNLDETPSHFPAAFTFENIISVGSFTNEDKISPFSNYGLSSVDLFAPGSQIQSTLPNNQYGALSGTSMAAPMVSGALVLLKSKFPELNYQEIISQLIGSVEYSEAFHTTCLSKGRLNLYNLINSKCPILLGTEKKSIKFKSTLLNSEIQAEILKIYSLNEADVTIDSIIINAPFHFSGGENKLNNIIVTKNGKSLDLYFDNQEIGTFNGKIVAFYHSGEKMVQIFIPVTATVFEKGTFVGGEISGMWIKEESPYIVNSDLFIKDNSGLTIFPGVEVIFDGHYKISCPHTSWIKAVGTEKDSIKFNAINKTIGWGGIRFHEEFYNWNGDWHLIYVKIECNKNIFRYCKFENGIKTPSDFVSPEYNKSGGAIFSFNADIQLNHCHFNANSTKWEGGALAFISNENTLIDSCIFINNSGYWTGTASIVGGRNIRILNTIFSSNIGGRSISKFLSENTIIHNCRFLNNGANKCAAMYIQGLNESDERYNPETFVLSNSLISNNHNCSWDAPIRIERINKSIIVNNTITNNYGGAGGGLLIVEGVTSILRNNIIWGNDNFQYKNTGIVAKDIIENNCIQDLSLDKNISTDPKFVNDSLFHLSSESPCINSGTQGSLFNDKDNTPNDLGYEGGSGLILDYLSCDLEDAGIFERSSPAFDSITIFNNNYNEINIKITNISFPFSCIYDTIIGSQSHSTIYFSFKPDSVGEFNHLVSLENNTNNSKKEIELRGTGISGTTLMGEISGQLRCENSPFLINGELIIPAEETLLIPSCADFYFTENSKLSVYGKLITEKGNSVIQFTSYKDSVLWDGISIGKTGSAEFYSCNFSGLKTIWNGGFKRKYNSAPTIFEDCIFENNITDNSLIIFEHSEGVPTIIDRCIFRNNTAPELITAMAVDTFLVSNSLFYDNNACIFSIQSSCKLYILNNTITNNVVPENISWAREATFYTGGNYKDKSPEIYIYNCILNNTEAPYFISGSPNKINIQNSYLVNGNDSFKYPSDSEITINNLFQSMPEFKDPYNNNFRLTANSQYIDKGENSVVSGVIDLAGAKRIWDGDSDGIANVDIGCFEYGSPYDTTNVVRADYSLLNKSNKELQILIFPNPNDGKFRLRFENGNTGKYQVQIINENGQVVLNKVVNIFQNIQEEEFNLSHLSKGNYFIGVFDGEKTNTEKIILK